MAIDLKVTVESAWLLETVTKNMQEHTAIYEKAFARYRDALLDFTEKELEKFRTNKSNTVSWFNGPRPTDHTADYDVVIQMLQEGTDNTLTLTASDFRRFVLDRWDWTDAFVSTSNAYGVSTKFDG